MSQDNKRQLDDPTADDESIRAIYKEIYEKNQRQLGEQAEEIMSLHFNEGSYICNTLTQYPKEDIKAYMYSFRELLYENPRQKNPQKTLLTALMTTYGFEHDLVEPIVKSKVKLLLVNDNSTNKYKDIIEESYQNYPNWKLVMPAKGGEGVRYPGAFHPKIWMLKFPRFLRIIIGSQNLHVADWTVWAQGMWVQDFQLKDKADIDDNEFRDMLKHFMKSILPKQIDFEKELELELNDYEMKGINIRLVCSLPQTFKGNEMYQYGSTRILSVVLEELKKNQLGGFKNPIITYQSTSLGDLNQKFLDQLSSHFCGRQVSKDLSTKSVVDEQIKNTVFKLVFPTKDYVINHTHGGVEFASTLFLRSMAYSKTTFPKSIFHRFEGNDHYYWNAGVIPHLKVFIITDGDQQITDSTVIYVGSHNLSQGAWGKLEKNGTQINICNTELGVLYPPGKSYLYKFIVSDTRQKKMDVIERLCFKFPPKQYEGDQPFIQDQL